MTPQQISATVPGWIGPVSSLLMIAAGVLGLWYKLHQVGISFRQFREAMKVPSVYIPSRVKIEVVAAAPEVSPGDFRDDTGKCDPCSDCGGGLVDIAGPGVKARLCPVCDYDSMALYEDEEVTQ